MLTQHRQCLVSRTWYTLSARLVAPLALKSPVYRSAWKRRFLLSLFRTVNKLAIVMGVMYPEPKYQVIDADPGVWKCLQAFRTSDWMFTAQATGVTTVMGYFMGRSSFMHRPTAVVAGITGFGFGVCFGLQNSMGRQMGLCENEAECQTA